MRLRSKVLPLSLILLLGVSSTTVFAEDTGGVTARIPVSCVAENTDEDFTYQITGESTEYEIIKNDSLVLGNGDTGVFEIDYTYPGTYSYEILQLSGNDDKTTYDTTVYDVDVFVTENEEGILSLEPIIYISGEADKKADCKFTNVRQSGIVGGVQNVKTGDNTNVSSYIYLMFASVFVIFTLIFKKGVRKR